MNKCINEARLNAGFFVGECLELFQITERTWYRWIKSGAPNWAHELLELKSGKLDAFGWKNWQIRNGILFCDQFRKPMSWDKQELLAYEFLRELKLSAVNAKTIRSRFGSPETASIPEIVLSLRSG